ncbi:MAG: tRNA glutamyl-Q(34) synthetase GluQRS [Coriobacteriales bacterium]
MSGRGAGVRGRFAPSPSGRMHFGNIFSACLAWLSARSAGGEFLLRLEDIDPRCQDPRNAELIMDDLRWLGIDWDADPLRQSARTELYRQALDEVGRRARLYPCFCSRADLHAASAPHASDGTPIYQGTCRTLSPQEAQQRRALKEPAWRVEVPAEQVAFTDRHMGPYSQRLDTECGDFVLLRSDGAFAYQLVVVVDDASSGVTEVVRGGDLIGSTPRQLWLYSLLGQPAPSYAHHPVLLAPDGKRLSKREKSLDMGALRASHSPQQLVGQVAFLAGLADTPQPVDLRELIPSFSWEKVPQGDIVLQNTTALA